jgi:cell division protein FtsB
MPSLEISPLVLGLLSIIPAIIMFLVQKMILKKQHEQFLNLEKENLNLNAEVLDLEKEINELKKQLAENQPSAGIVRMDEKQKTKIG